jgi:hypothetical protein
MGEKATPEFGIGARTGRECPDEQAFKEKDRRRERAERFCVGIGGIH